jgi:branched-chain amino acid transport system permease protein
MSGYVEGIIILVGINIIAVLGISILTGFTRLFSFGNAGFMSIGAYTSAILTIEYHVPFIVAMILGASLAAIVSYGLGKLTLNLKGDYFLITTLGFGECVRILMEYMDKYTGGARGLAGIEQSTSLTVVIISVILALFLAWNFIHSKYGRCLIAVREQEVAAASSGVDVFSAKQMSFVISAFLAGWSGALFAHYYTFITPAMFNLDKSSELTITVVIGGLGSLTGSVISTMILTCLPEIMRAFANYRMLFYGLAVVLVVTLKPSGLMGYKEFSLSGIIRFFRKKHTVEVTKNV